MTKRIAISQSNYLPWKGYFDMIAYVDEFVLYDDMQYTKRDWRNRNQIKTIDGLKWLTVPVKVKGKYLQKIRETEIDGSDWVKKHWGAIVQNYKDTPHFKELSAILKSAYFDLNPLTISECNRNFIDIICEYLCIETHISNSWDYLLIEGKSERLLDICIQAGATEYVSGRAAKGYLNEKLFLDAGIKITWFEYADYPEYPQQFGEFNHFVTILDLLFNKGGNSSDFMKFAPKKGAYK